MRSGQALHQIQARENRCRGPRLLRLIEEALVRVETDGDPNRIILVGCPVEAAEADEAICLACGADINIVAAFAINVVGSAVTEDDVVALDRLCTERIEIVAGGAIAGAPLDPVVTLVAEGELIGLGAVDEVVTRTTQGLRAVLTGDDEVIAETA